MASNAEVVVITGATSGIGRAAATEFARRGRFVVLAGRRPEALAEVEAECKTLGAGALARQTDVTREDDVRALATAALAERGRIDVWINNAGVTLFGSLEGAPMEEHRRVIETNLFGAIYGARAVIPVFREQKRGVLINVGSVLSQVGQPFVPSYVISKFALRGLTEALRAELAHQEDIHVCSLLPYAVDTEHFESGANRIGLGAHAMPPAQTPEKIARALVHLAERPRRELHVPRAAVLGVAAHALFPRTIERVISDILARWHFDGELQPMDRGNLYEPKHADGQVRGARPPQLGTAPVVLFALRRFVEIWIERAMRSIRGGRPQPGAADRLVGEPLAEHRALQQPG